MTTTKTVIATVKQTAAKNIAKALRTQHQARRDLTISALFSSLIQADVSFMAGFTKADAGMFDTTLRSMLPVQFKTKQGGYTFDKVKAEKVRTELGAVFQETTWDEFADKLLLVWMHGHQAAQGAEIDAQEKRLNASKSVQRSLEKALMAGLSMHELDVLFTKFKAANGGVTPGTVFNPVVHASDAPAPTVVQH